LIQYRSSAFAHLAKTIFEEDFLPCAFWIEPKLDNIKLLLNALYGEHKDIKKALFEICQGKTVYFVNMTFKGLVYRY
jgi:hypothetical protein